MKIEKLIEILEKYFQSFINQKEEWKFFLGLADYVKYILEVNELREIIDKVRRKELKREKEFKRQEIKIANGFQEIEKEVLKIKDENRISPSRMKYLLKKFENLREEQKNLINKAKNSLWGNFRFLYIIYLIFYPQKGKIIWRFPKESLKIWEIDLPNLSENSKKYSTLKTNIEFFALRVHNYLIQELNAKIIEEKKKNEIITSPLFTNDGVLSFLGKKIEFRIDSNPYYLLKTLFKHPKEIWNYDEIAEDWGYQEYEKLDWKKFYNAGYFTNLKIAKETGIKDFLIITSKTININQKYLKS